MIIIFLFVSTLGIHQTAQKVRLVLLEPPIDITDGQDYEEEEGGLLRLELLETDKRNLGSVSRHWRRSQHHRRPDLRDLRRRPRTRRLRSSSSSSSSSSSQPPPGDVVFLRSYRDGPVDLRTEALMRGMG